MAKKFSRKKATKGEIGTGLEALLGSNRVDKETVKQLSKEFAMLSIGKILPNPDQPRKDFEEEPLEELAKSIDVHGIIQPITVRAMGDGTFQIISGERRYQASKRANKKVIPAFIRTADDQSLLEMALVENIQRRDLNPMEIAFSYYRLQNEFNLTQAELGERVNEPRGTVSGYLNILNTAPKVQQAIRERKISIGAAKTFSGIKDPLLQEKFLEEILANPKLTVRDLETRAKTYKGKKSATGGKKGKSRAPKNEDAELVRDAFGRFFGTKKVKVDMEGNGTAGGTITLTFVDKEELHQFYKAVE